MTEVLEQLSQTCHLVNHLWNDLCPFQRWLRGWCWEEWHTSLKTAVNICLRWVQCKHRKHMTPAHFSKMSLLISSCFVFTTWVSTPSPIPFSSHSLSTPPSGKLVRRFCVIRCQNSAGRDRAAIPGQDQHWNTLTDNNTLRIHSSVHSKLVK